MSIPDAAPERCFVDINIWLYAFIEGDEPTKTAARPLRQCDHLTGDALQPCARCHSTDHRDERRAAPRLLNTIIHAYGLSGGDYSRGPGLDESG